MPLLLLLSCTTATTAPVTITGTLVPRWWGNDTDPSTEGAKLVVRLDTPLDGMSTVLYATPSTATASAAACLNGKITLKGPLEPVPDHRYADATMPTAEVLACTPNVAQAPVPLGPGTVLTGTLERRWRYGSPGYSATPGEDRVNIGASLVLTDGVVVPVELPRATPEDTATLWDLLRVCDGKEVTVTGTYRATKRPDARPPFVLDEARLTGGCLP